MEKQLTTSSLFPKEVLDGIKAIYELYLLPRTILFHVIGTEVSEAKQASGSENENEIVPHDDTPCTCRVCEQYFSMYSDPFTLGEGYGR